MFKIVTPELALYDAPDAPASGLAELDMDIDGLSDIVDEEEEGIDLEEGAEVAIATPGTIITSSALFMRCVLLPPPPLTLPRVPPLAGPSR